MILEQRLKDIEKKCSLCGSRVAVDDLLQALRKALEQRDNALKLVDIASSGTRVYFDPDKDIVVSGADNNILEILEGK